MKRASSFTQSFFSRAMCTIINSMLIILKRGGPIMSSVLCRMMLWWCLGQATQVERFGSSSKEPSTARLDEGKKLFYYSPLLSFFMASTMMYNWINELKIMEDFFGIRCKENKQSRAEDRALRHSGFKKNNFLLNFPLCFLVESGITIAHFFMGPGWLKWCIMAAGISSGQNRVLDSSKSSYVFHCKKWTKPRVQMTAWHLNPLPSSD